jgi:predicted amidohydrolase
VKLALAQLEIVPGEVGTNRDAAVAAVESAAACGADLVVLPEIFTVGYFAFDAYARTAESVEGHTIDSLGDVAAEHDVALLAGSIVEDLAASTADGVATPAGEGYANTSVFLDRNGTRQAVYRKHHLFGYDSAERELLTPGERAPTVDFDGFTLGMTTCYDLRFPELYRELADNGATLVVVPSAWPYPRVEHWQLLPRARAVENLTYVAAANGVGTFEDASLLGRSAVFDPWGTTIAAAGDESTLVTADLDADRVDAVRAEFPALGDRRDDRFYRG